MCPPQQSPMCQRLRIIHSYTNTVPDVPHWETTRHSATVLEARHLAGPGTVHASLGKKRARPRATLRRDVTRRANKKIRNAASTRGTSLTETGTTQNVLYGLNFAALGTLHPKPRHQLVSTNAFVVVRLVYLKKKKSRTISFGEVFDRWYKGSVPALMSSPQLHGLPNSRGKRRRKGMRYLYRDAEK